MRDERIRVGPPGEERVCSTESRKNPATTWLRRKEVAEIGAPD